MYECFLQGEFPSGKFTYEVSVHYRLLWKCLYYSIWEHRLHPDLSVTTTVTRTTQIANDEHTRSDTIMITATMPEKYK